MKLKDAKELFNKIVDLFYDSGNQRLIEVIESIYPDATAAEDTADIVSCCEELQVAINEIDVYSEEEEFVQEINDLIEHLNELNE